MDKLYPADFNRIKEGLESKGITFVSAEIELIPSSTIDFNCKTGADIKIEEREPTEISTKFFSSPIALPDVKCYNPAFDVTDNELITAIITEKGICRAPYTESLAEKFKK